jgi:hypothetical protein
MKGTGSMSGSNASKDDAGLFRDGPVSRADARKLLLRPGLKVLLMAAPLDGTHLNRDLDFGRDVDL